MAKYKGERKHAVIFILLSILWISFLFVESSQPPSKIISEVSGLDKVAHFVAFGILTLLLIAASFNLNGKKAISLFLLPSLISMLFGVIEESYQMYVPGRLGSLSDMAADIFGSIFAVFMAKYTMTITKIYITTVDD